MNSHVRARLMLRTKLFRCRWTECTRQPQRQGRRLRATTAKALETGRDRGDHCPVGSGQTCDHGLGRLASLETADRDGDGETAGIVKAADLTASTLNFSPRLWVT